MAKRWTNEEIAYLKANFATAKGVNDLAEHLGRARSTVNAKARSMGLKTNRRAGNPNFGKQMAGAKGKGNPVEFILDGQNVTGKLIDKLDNTLVVEYEGVALVVYNIKGRKNYLHAVPRSKATINHRRKVSSIR